MSNLFCFASQWENKLSRVTETDRIKCDGEIRSLTAYFPLLCEHWNVTFESMKFPYQ